MLAGSSQKKNSSPTPAAVRAPAGGGAGQCSTASRVPLVRVAVLQMMGCLCGTQEVQPLLHGQALPATCEPMTWTCTITCPLHCLHSPPLSPSPLSSPSQVAFDSIKQVQMISFLVQRPRGATDYCALPDRSVSGV